MLKRKPKNRSKSLSLLWVIFFSKKQGSNKNTIQNILRRYSYFVGRQFPYFWINLRRLSWWFCYKWQWRWFKPKNMIYFSFLSRYGSFAQAITKPDGLASLGILVRLHKGHKSSEVWNSILALFETTQHPSLQSLSDLTLASFLPSTTDFFRYNGSVTSSGNYNYRVAMIFWDKSSALLLWIAGA